MQPLQNLMHKFDSVNLPEPVKHPVRVVKVLVQDFIRCDLLKQASAMAYVTLLSLIPSLVAIFCVLSLFAPIMGNGNDLVDDIKDFILQNLASGSGEAAVKYLDNMLEHLNLASIGWSSFASVLVSLVLLLRQIEEALNRIWLVHKGRNIFTRFMYFWTFLTLGLVVLAIGIGVSSGFDPHKLMGVEPDVHGAAHGIVTWLVSFGGGFLFFFFLYKVVPNCTVLARNAAIGAAVSAFVLNQAGRFYGIYVRDAKNYQTLYGAMAQLPLFLMWLYICWIIILLGALISWRAQEGFPKEEEEETIDAAQTPLEQLRNAQVKAAMPLIALLAIYKNFRQGTGKGMSGQELGHLLKLPLHWVSEAIEALTALGYIVAAKGGEHGGDAHSVTDQYFPAFPAESVSLVKLRTDLSKPMDDWMEHWHHDLPLDLRQKLKALSGPTSGTLASVLSS